MATRAPSGFDHHGKRFEQQRDKLTTYFDSTARKAWIDLTSDAKVSGIRATVRAGRDSMRDVLLSWLPHDLRRTRVLDAGCGTGALSVLAARRGAEVVGVDVAGGLVAIAKERQPSFLGHGRIHWRVGDMLDPAHGRFDHVVAMDSLIHYRPEDIVATLVSLAERCDHSIVFTHAPATPMLRAMHTMGLLFPRSDRAPAIVPVSEPHLVRLIGAALPGWRVARRQRIGRGFYISNALELVRD
ncbi:MAG: magnesium protoporphyrin IX methyltransferase [Novosphingobium sp.]|uniref:magnesium protoporphyrin IX methyltransferase n=1 Tax=Novosphingobium sp. TaxID=1874826 RepID=UPI003017CDA3